LSVVLSAFNKTSNLPAFTLSLTPGSGPPLMMICATRSLFTIFLALGIFSLAASLFCLVLFFRLTPSHSRVNCPFGVLPNRILLFTLDPFVPLSKPFATPSLTLSLPRPSLEAMAILHELTSKSVFIIGDPLFDKINSPHT